ncbi:putative U3 small nucleolar RNA-associated protein 11-like protein [Leptotrombidium deliense]|uniref:U3 small nucleolar RNA-associated protein 11 n=1 Tax=Leptotrombidium deliense TaxID=299467 RepID=A0A443S131_9ACAR|nr:putative U3 small nucleolar RNA-associated protein 11-like protein [Leptotrombidium deliense]
MASLKNANKSFQRLHRERHQPESRKHLGFLEKKKDYKKRADDFNQKQRTLKLLHQKALNKNPDEFYFRMINSQLKDGVHYTKRKDDELTNDQLALMQSQDMKYVAYKRSVDLKKIEKLKASLHLIDMPDKPANKHIFFTDTKKEAKKKNELIRLDTHPDLLDMAYNLPKVENLQDEEFVSDKVVKLLPIVEKERQKAYRELVKRADREKQLKILMDKMAVKQNLINKKEAVKEKDGTTFTAPVYKWRKERQK